MKKSFPTALLAIGLSLSGVQVASAKGAAQADNCAPKGMTEITVTHIGEGALATYQLGQAVSCLKLGDNGAVRKLSWEIQTSGAVLSDDGNIVHFASPRKEFAVRLRAFGRDGLMDRVYSPLIAFGDGSAVAVYTSYLRPAMMERGVFFAFSGFAPTAPERNVGLQRIGNEQTYLIVGQPALERRGKIAAVIDHAMPSWLLRHVMLGISQGELALRSVSDATRAASYLITYTEPTASSANWRGDTLDGLVRLNFMGAQWQQEQPGMADRIDQFILHELFHTASARALNPYLPGAMTLSEGGSEAVAMTLLRRGAASAADALAADIDNAISRCQGIPGTTLAEKEQKGQRNTPYVCGMALQFMVAAAVRRDPFEIWEHMLRKVERTEAGWPTFLEAAANKATANMAALAVLKEMTASRIDWESGTAQLLGAGLLRPRTEAELGGQAYEPLYIKNAIFHLLRASCSKGYGFHDLRPVYLLHAPSQTCGVIPDKFRLIAMNGLRLSGDAHRAHRELARRCAAGLPVELTDDNGQRIELPCASLPKDIVLYTLAPAPRLN